MKWQFSKNVLSFFLTKRTLTPLGVKWVNFLSVFLKPFLNFILVSPVKTVNFGGIGINDWFLKISTRIKHRVPLKVTGWTQSK